MHIKKRLLLYLTRHLLKAVNEDDLLLIANGRWTTGGRELTREEKDDIRAEAKIFSQSLLWRFISRELEYTAFVRGRKATSVEDITMTHAMYYNLDLIQAFLNRCRNL